MQRICRGFMGLVAVVILLACSSPAPPEQRTAGTPAAKQPPQPDAQKPQAKIGDTPEGLIALIEDKKADPEKRKDNFERLKKEYPAEALAFARVKADEFSSTSKELHRRMGIGERRGNPDKEAEGDFEIGALAVSLVIKTDLEKYKKSEEKVRYLIKTAVKKNWVSGTGGFIEQYCGTIDANVGHDFTSEEDGRFLAVCSNDCDLECLQKINSRHQNDWTSDGMYLKTKTLVKKCKEYKVCEVDEFIHRLTEPNNDDDIHKMIIATLVGWPWAHCIPYDEMLKKAEKTGNAGFIEALKREYFNYTGKQSGNCDKQHKPIPRQRGE